VTGRRGKLSGTFCCIEMVGSLGSVEDYAGSFAGGLAEAIGSRLVTKQVLRLPISPPYLPDNPTLTLPLTLSRPSPPHSTPTCSGGRRTARPWSTVTTRPTQPGPNPNPNANPDPDPNLNPKP